MINENHSLGLDRVQPLGNLRGLTMINLATFITETRICTEYKLKEEFTMISINYTFINYYQLKQINSQGMHAYQNILDAY